MNVPACGVGIARAALEDAVAYTDEREQFDQPVGAFQGVRWTVAEMAQLADAARLLTIVGGPNELHENALADAVYAETQSG